MTSPVSAIVLAAGAGTRMRSDRPKPLHLLCGRPMLFHVLDAMVELDLDRTVVVVGRGAEKITKKVQDGQGAWRLIDAVEQRVPRGTGDAAAVGLTALHGEDDDDHTVVVVPGDAPLLRPSTMRALVDQHVASGAAATLLTARLDDPTGYGRIVRSKDGRVARVIEHRDATDEQRAITEVCTSIYCFRLGLLGPALRQVQPLNASGEYYLTDVIALLHDAGYRIDSYVVDDQSETIGVNDRAQLATAEAVLRHRINTGWLHAGVTMLDPSQVFIDATVSLGTDVTLFPGTILQGRTVVGSRCEIGPDTRLVDTVVGDDCVIENSVARDADIGDGCRVGPFAAIGPGAELSRGTTTGPFYTATSAG